MKVSELGEFGLINLLADIIDKRANLKGITGKKLLLGIGDDTAVWKSDAISQLATTDSLIQDIHFNLKDTDWEMLGHKAIAVNLSDIASMGGIPEYALISLALPGYIDVECISSLYHGMVNISNQFNMAIAGGNIASSSKVMISVTVIGRLKDNTFLSRSASKPGDKIAITGYTGLAAAGLLMLKQNLNFDTATQNLLYEAYLKPSPRIQEGEILLEQGVKAAIDISDGLIADLTHICKASRVNATIRRDLIPIHPALASNFRDDYNKFILNGGEDYELLFTADQKVIENVKQATSRMITTIGSVTEGKTGEVSVVDDSGTIIPWQSGWEHFKS
jgi:thiamine-monophosphate kinase